MSDAFRGDYPPTYIGPPVFRVICRRRADLAVVCHYRWLADGWSDIGKEIAGVAFTLDKCGQPNTCDPSTLTDKPKRLWMFCGGSFPHRHSLLFHICLGAVPRGRTFVKKD